MTSQLLGPADIIRLDVESVVAAASRAPSIHNTQPWRWTFDGRVLELRADRSRQLHVADRDGHSLLVSCGAAAELTVLALRTQGWSADVEIMPDASDPDLLTRFTLTGHGADDHEAAVELAAAAVRRSERRAFGMNPVTPEVIDDLCASAAFPGVYAHFPSRPDELLDLAVAVSTADRSEHDDPAFAAELAAWSHVDADDGIPDSAIPGVSAGRPRHTDIPVRDFDDGTPGAQLINTPGIDERPLIAVILTDRDRPTDRLVAGRSMMRLMIQAERAGLATCCLSQSVDLLAFRIRVQMLMSWTGHPQMMLRLGERPAGEPAPLTARRRVQDVLNVS